MRYGSPIFGLGITCAIVCALPGASFAQGPALSGGRDVFSVGDCAAPITLRFVTETKPAAVRTGDVAPRPAASPPGWTIEWDRPAVADAAINEYTSTGHLKEGCPAPGLFSVPLTVYGEDRSAAPLVLTLIRVAEPVIDIPGGITLVVERFLGAPAPAPLLIRELVAGAPDTRVSVLGGELKTASGESTGIALEPATPTVVVKAGETTQVMLAPTQAPAPGLYTAKLGVTGPAIRPGTAVDVTYKVRVTSDYLLTAIVLGILLGLLVNVILAKRAALDTALLTGLRAMQSLTRRATPQRDPAVQQRLLAVANLLQSGIEESMTPEEVAARVAEAEAQAKEIENKVTESASTLQQSLTGARAMFRPGGHELDAMLGRRLDAPLADLDQLQRMADAGDVEQTTARLQDFNRDLPARVLPVVQGLLADARSELQALGPLPDGSALAGKRDELSKSIEEAYAETDLTAGLKAADEVARQLRAWMDLVAPEAVATLWRQAARLLTGTPALAQRLNAAAVQAEQLGRTTRDPLERLGALGGLGRTVTAAMIDADPKNTAVADALALGDYLGAARRLSGQALGQTQLSLAPQTAVEEPAPAPGRAVVVVPTPAPVPVLRVKPLIPLNQDSNVVLRWVGVQPTADRVVWTCHPAEAAVLQPAGSGAIVRPSQAGFLNIYLELDKVRVAEARTYAGEVAEQGLYTVAAREGRLARHGITVATALLTAFAGYQIFLPTWFGTAADFFGAFVWGFFGQFGLDRVRELVKPLMSRSIPS